GVQKIAGFKGDRPEILRAMPLDQFFDCLAVRLNGPKAAGKKRAINVIVTDTNERLVLILENGVLRYRRNRESAGSDCAVTLTRDGLNELFTGRSTPAEKIRSGQF